MGVSINVILLSIGLALEYLSMFHKKGNIKKKSNLNYKKVVEFLIGKLRSNNQEVISVLEKDVVNLYVDYFNSNPIDDYKAHLNELSKFPKKKKATKKSITEKPKFIYPNYNHPKWHRKRLEIFKRDNYKCRACGDNKDLQCHHSYYENGKHIWEYPSPSLITLCRECHEEFHAKIKGKDLVKK